LNLNDNGNVMKRKKSQKRGDNTSLNGSSAACHSILDFSARVVDSGVGQIGEATTQG
jgi:hypothetical protein